MKILTISNLYPPHYIGGYELGCRDVMAGLSARGHEVRVLTSRYGSSATTPADTGPEREVIRTLPDPFKNGTTVPRGRLGSWLGLVAFERDSLAAWRQALGAEKPDVIYCWNLNGISMSILSLAAQSGCAVAFYLSDEWLLKWPLADPKRRWFERPTGSFFMRAGKSFLDLVFRLPGWRVAGQKPDLHHAQFTSRSLQAIYSDSQWSAATAQVIHWGIDPARFSPRPTSGAAAPKRLLYVGQMARHKGVHTVVEAFRLLLQSGRYPGLELTLVGGGLEHAYYDELVAAIQTAQLGSSVHLPGQLPREQLSSIYHSHDILVFPSLWAEPFSITLLEALSSGLAVVGTTTGGSGEILVPEVNALTFPAGDAAACTQQLARLLDDPGLLARLAQAGRQTVREHFRFDAMLDKIEAALIAATSR